MSYWDITDRYLAEHGGQGPECCGQPMAAQDDHGRFHCFSCGRTTDVVTECDLSVPRIPQVNTTGMTDAEKARIPPINRLTSTPTKAEQDFFTTMMKGGPGSPEYVEAIEALKKERGGEEDPP